MPKNTLPRSRRAVTPKPSQKSKAKSAPAAAPTWSQGYDATMAQLAASLDLKNLDDRGRAFLAACQKIDQRWTGDNAPFEAFIHNLVRRVAMGELPTPDDAADDLETFRGQFEAMRSDAAWFFENYPQAGAAPQTRQESAARIDRLEANWESKTPPELIYQLECFSPNDLEQRVHLTRAEYVALKEQLVRIRGFAAQEAARTEGGQGRG